MKDRKYDIEIDGYRIRNNADFNRVDMSKSQRNRYNRKMKLEKRNSNKHLKRDWYRQLHEELMYEISRIK